jgi:predicted amino acid-binding ACT domain protein
VVFVTPLKGAKQVKAAEAAGFLRTGSLHSVRLEGADKPGLGAKMTKALAGAGINLRGLSAAAIGKRFIAYLALDTADDGEEAIRVLKKLS